MKGKGMKKVLCVVAVLCLLIGTFAACSSKGDSNPPASTPPGDTGGSSADAAAPVEIEPVTLRVAHPHPAGSDADATYNRMKDYAAEYSNGAVTLEIFPAGSLVASNEMFQAVYDGTVDIGHIVGAEASTAIPALTVLDIPGTISWGLDDMLALNDPLTEIFSKSGFHYLDPTPIGPLEILCDTKQIVVPEDLKGMTTRTTGKYVGEAVIAWGGSPATIPLGDLPTALERHTVDAVLLDGLAVQMFKMYESCNYVTKTNFQGAVSYVLMNGAKWDSLSPEQQDVLQRAVHQATLDEVEGLTKTLSSLDDEMTAHGNDVYELTEAEKSAFLDKSSAVIDEAIKIGGADGQMLYDATKKLK
jgi:TRAP-type C4-dicarboxylate transport system substrate-binding protein